VTDRFSTADFANLMRALADAWARNDAAAGAALFRDDATYSEPPDEQLFVGRDQIEAYFSPLEPGTYLDLHHLWFDPSSGVGAIEFSFGTRGEARASHGVAIVTVVDGRIADWREYQTQGPSSFAQFTATEGKTWRWHIGNYP
jgi:ketosteroid isomerase-like protein